MKEQIFPEGGPPPAGPYSPGIKANGFVFVSGQGPIHPESGQKVAGGIADQVHRVMQNLQLVLDAAGTSMEKVVKTTIYLTDLGSFEAVNGVYAEFFGESPPARACVEVSALPKGARVEIEAVAVS